MILDCHIHLMESDSDPAEFKRKINDVGIDGGVLISMPPESFTHKTDNPGASERISHAVKWRETVGNSFAFFWIDPTEPDALKQVETAVAGGIDGFKIIPTHFYPGDPKCIEVCRKAAAAGKPVLFHSGILWDGRPSSKYCRPVEFEAMLDVPKLRFALAHISWPWTDECIAVFGKILAAKRSRPELSCEMFIDTTPGTPMVYRKEAFYRLWYSGCKVEDNVIFGTDGSSSHYPREGISERLVRDKLLYDELGIKPDVRKKVFYDNILRFVGK